MSTPPAIAEQYRFAVDSFIDLARTLDDVAWPTAVPCTPVWTVRDVLSHVSGIPDDAALRDVWRVPPVRHGLRHRSNTTGCSASTNSSPDGASRRQLSAN